MCVSLNLDSLKVVATALVLFVQPGVPVSTQMASVSPYYWLS